MWPTDAGCKAAGRQDPWFYRPEAVRQCQKSTARLELLVELVLTCINSPSLLTCINCPSLLSVSFEGEQASVANWKMESSNDSFYCLLLILNIKQIIVNHSQLNGFLSSTTQTTPGVEKFTDFQK